MNPPTTGVGAKYNDKNPRNGKSPPPAQDWGKQNIQYRTRNFELRSEYYVAVLVLRSVATTQSSTGDGEKYNPARITPCDANKPPPAQVWGLKAGLNQLFEAG